MRILVLPGMDGGAALSVAFRTLLARDHDVVGLEYPAHERRSYDELFEELLDRVAESSEPTLVVAESFSGPLGIRLAAADLPQLAGVVLVATFARSPMMSALRFVVSPAVFAVTPPAFAVRATMLDGDVSDERLFEVLAAISEPDARVMSHRLHQVLAVDVREELERARVPLLALRASHDRLVRAPRFVEVEEVHDVDSPHLLLFSRPDRAAQLVRDWVPRLSGG